MNSYRYQSAVSFQALLGFALLAPAAQIVAQTSGAERPNVLFIMSDDHTSQAIGVYGSRLAGLNPTPVIDRIGREGIVFNNAFCTNAISTPSRACIISGQYSQTNGVLDLSGELVAEKQNLPREMKALGYETAVVGKWHLGILPEAFDYYQVLYDQGEYFDPVLVSPEDTTYAVGKWGKRRGRQFKGHSSDVLTDCTLDWLENRRDKSKPFFLCHHFKAPHDLFEFHPRYKDYLEDTFIPEPGSLWYDGNHGSEATYGKDRSLADTIGSSVGKRNRVRNMGRHMDIDPSLPDDEYKRAAYQEYLKRYLRCVKGVDDNVKRIFDYLEKEGLMDNTIIVYTGDQGFFLGEHDYIDKRWMYEEAMRMPLLMRYPPKIKAGTRTDAIVNNVDFAPTLIELCGGKKPAYMQGDSFAWITDGSNEPKGWKQHTYYRYWMHMAHGHNNPAHFGIRTHDYKLIFFYGTDYRDRKVKPRNARAFQFNKMLTPAGWELYDLRKDPQELNNVYGRPEYARVTEELKALLKQERERLNETDLNYPKIQAIIEANR